jgi:hypothetical protein
MLGVKEAEHVLSKKSSNFFGTCSHDRRTLPAFYAQAVHFPWERVAEEPALFTRRMFVRLSRLPIIRVLAQQMRSTEIRVSPLRLFATPGTL